GIYSVLSDIRTFHRLPDGRYGLTVWYPAAKVRTAPVPSQRKQKHGQNKKKPKVVNSQQSQKHKEPKRAPDLNVVVSDAVSASPSAAVIEYIRLHPHSK